MDGQTPTDLMNVLQEVRVQEGISGRLTVKENPFFWNLATVDAVFGLERGTPVFLFLA
jgi:hypothetical protein